MSNFFSQYFENIFVYGFILFLCCCCGCIYLYVFYLYDLFHIILLLLQTYGSIVATGRASHASQVKGDDPDKKGYPGPPGWGLGHGADNPIPIK
jgi:hypothetical protein